MICIQIKQMDFQNKIFIQKKNKEKKMRNFTWNNIKIHFLYTPVNIISTIRNAQN